MILEAQTLARVILRKTKLTGLAHQVRMLWHRSDYEDRFADLVLASIQPDDCVWDVGANVGFYTAQFSRLARYVVAFEPVAANCAQIESQRMTNVNCQQLALGDAAGALPMFVDVEYSSLAVRPRPEASRQMVKVVRGDDLTNLLHPTVVKIDVEGYELEVIRGMAGVLSRVRALFLEIHFQILASRGTPQAPAALVRDLRRLGFSRIEWPDASHIAAFRT